MPGLFNFLVGGGNNETPSDAALKDLLNERTGGRGEIKVKEIVCISPYTSVSVSLSIIAYLELTCHNQG